MPDREAIERGLAFEARVAEALGGSQMPASGALWGAQGDASGSGVLASAKAEKSRTWAQTRRQLREAVEMAQGTGRAPTLAILDDDGEELIVMLLGDFSRALDIAPNRQQRIENKRQRAVTPVLLRERPDA